MAQELKNAGCAEACLCGERIKEYGDMNKGTTVDDSLRRGRGSSRRVFGWILHSVGYLNEH